MKSEDHTHLQEEQIIRAVIDENDLVGEDRQHLLECQLCNRKVALFKDELQQLGKNSRMSVPLLTKTITLPRAEVTPVSHKSSWLPSFGVAAMAGLVLFLYFLGMESMSPRLATMQSLDGLLEDEYLMEEIFEMVENPLSEDLYDITGDNEGFDEDFLDFIVPAVQEDFQAIYLTEGGLKQC